MIAQSSTRTKEQPPSYEETTIQATVTGTGSGVSMVQIRIERWAWMGDEDITTLLWGAPDVRFGGEK